MILKGGIRFGMRILAAWLGLWSVAQAESKPVCEGLELGAAVFFPTVAKTDVVAQALRANAEKSTQKLAARVQQVDARTVGIGGQGYQVCVSFVNAEDVVALAAQTKRVQKLRGLPSAARVTFRVDGSYRGAAIAGKAPMGAETGAVPWELLVVLESLNGLAGVLVYDFTGHEFYPKD